MVTGPARLDGYDGHIAIACDHLDRPLIEAASWRDAALGLGWSMARQRRAQMDVLWRRSHGTLAAHAGRSAVPQDVRQRRLGTAAIARRCLDMLPAWQRQWLDAFTRGVNLATGPGHVQLWHPVASIAVAQMLYQSLVSDGSDVRMVEVMRRTLPPALADFLLCDNDTFETSVDGTAAPPREVPFPREELQKVMAMPPPADELRLVVSSPRPAGSNAWAVSLGGSALLANDMHMELTYPSLWWAASMSVRGAMVTGVSVPGLPTLVAGTNGHVAWGFTRLPADTAELREVAPGSKVGCYRVAGQEEHFRIRTETIVVRGGPAEVIEVRETRWGPIVGELAGRPVAFGSTLLDPGALDFGLGRMYTVTDIEQAVTVVTEAGLPPLNAVLADASGGVAWAAAGRFPRRDERGPRGFSAATEEGYPATLAPQKLPRIVNPPSGFVVSCNNGNWPSREAGLAWNFFPGDRARRVSALLTSDPAVDDRSELRRQLDLDASSLDFYRDVALRHLSGDGARSATLRAELQAWRGTAHQDERGLALIVAFRDLIREHLLAAATRPCRAYDPEFTYCYHDPDAPLRPLVAALEDGLVPAPWTSPTAFVVSQLLLARALLTRRTGTDAAVRWGQVNRLSLQELICRDGSAAPVTELSGCPESICVSQEDFGASMRLTVALARPWNGSLSVPGSQSASPDTNDECVTTWVAGSAARLPGTAGQPPPSS